MLVRDNLSDHFTFQEGIRSNTAYRLGIDNIPDHKQYKNMCFVANNIGEHVRNFCKSSITTTSWLRVKELNRALGSKDTSYHIKGCAMDLDKLKSKKSYKEIFDFIWQNLEFSELIWEYGSHNEPRWVHIAYEPGNKNKRVKRALSKEEKKKNGH